MTPSPTELTASDRALLLALRTWGGGADPRFWEAFHPDWRERLRDAQGTAPAAPDAARDRLRRAHAAQARPDLSRVHASWWVRALQGETPAVRRAVVAHAPEAIRETLQAGLALTAEDLATDRPPLPEAIRGAWVLWTERLVGDLPERDEDPPVIVALTRLDLREVTRLIESAGLAKAAVVGEMPEELPAPDRAWFEHVRTALAASDARFRQQAGRDLATFGRRKGHEGQRLGLVTIGRLLAVVEPYRVRWALQHLPYPVAKFARSVMDPDPRRAGVLAAWESEVLRAAEDRLRGRQSGAVADD